MSEFKPLVCDVKFQKMGEKLISFFKKDSLLKLSSHNKINHL